MNQSIKLPIGNTRTGVRTKKAAAGTTTLEYRRSLHAVRQVSKTAEGRKAILEVADAIQGGARRKVSERVAKVVSFLKVSAAILGIMLTFYGMAAGMEVLAEYYCMGNHVVNQDPLWCIGRDGA